MSVERIKRNAKRMIEQDVNLTTYRVGYEDMARMQWNLPAPMYRFAWIRKSLSAAPYNAIRGAIRALANLSERLFIEPVTVLNAVDTNDDKSIATRKKANEWEKALIWAVDKAARRNAGFRDTVIWNAVVHDEIVGQIVHLPTQHKALGKGGVGAKAALRYGDWAIKLVDVKSMHIDYSTEKPERVLCVNVKTAQQLLDEYGEKKLSSIAAKVKRKGEHAKDKYIEFDYVDYENRLIWVSEGTKAIDAVEDKKAAVVMGPEPWLKDTGGEPVPFLPWVSVVGGTITDELPEFRRKPIGFPILQSAEWVNTNIMKTMLQSMAIAEIGAPRTSVKGPGAEFVQSDYGEPGGRVNLNAYQVYERIQQLGLDPQLREMYEMVEQAIRDATVSDILVTGAPLGGVEAASGYNLQLQTAVASLGAFKALAERFYERLYEAMLLITYYTGAEIKGYGEEDGKYVIDSEDINPESIYLTVELTPDVPADRLQRVTAANAMAQNLQYPIRKILEFLGETDPEGAIEEWMIEQYRTADWMGRVERRRMMQSGELEQMAQQMAMQMMQQQMQQQPQGGMPPEAPMSPEQAGAMGNPPNMGGPPGMYGIEGQMWNPAMGGTAPIAAGMGATFEGATGRTRGGEELA